MSEGIQREHVRRLKVVSICSLNLNVHVVAWIHWHLGCIMLAAIVIMCLHVAPARVVSGAGRAEAEVDDLVMKL